MSLLEESAMHPAAQYNCKPRKKKPVFVMIREDGKKREKKPTHYAKLPVSTPGEFFPSPSRTVDGMRYLEDGPPPIQANPQLREQEKKKRYPKSS